MYLAFETRVGDLAAIAKVDKRRREAVSREFTHAQTLLLIDRYTFLDLLPCSQDLLKAVGYRVSVAHWAHFRSAMSADICRRVPHCRRRQRAAA